jgi:hypothetical protein
VQLGKQPGHSSNRRAPCLGKGITQTLHFSPSNDKRNRPFKTDAHDRSRAQRYNSEDLKRKQPEELLMIQTGERGRCSIS